MRALLFGTYDTSLHPRIATIAEGLRAHGIEVAECNAPLGLDTAAKVDMLAHPWRAPALLVRLARRWATLTRAASRMPAPDVVLVGYLGHFDVLLARLLFRKVPVVLDHLIGASDTGRDRRLGGIARQVLLRTIDACALRAADIIVVDTEEHLARLPERHQARAVVVPVGAPSAWHLAAGPARPDDDGQPLRVVFYGLYTPLQGASVIGSALGRMAGAPIEVTMIGDGQDKAATMAAAGTSDAVRWLDWVPAAELPALVASHDVCLGIFGAGDKALRVVPNKVFQGAAAGCAIVTSDTAPQRRALAGAGLLVPPGDPDALAAALLRLAGDRGELARLRQRAREVAQEQFVPERIVIPLIGKLATARSTAMATAAQDEAPGAGPAPARRQARPDIEMVAPLTPNAWLRYELIKRMLPGGISDVLEIGCGQGALGVRLAQRYRYLGVEPDRASWAVASKRISAAGRGEVRNVAAQDLGDSQFDLICAFEVLEHIEDDAAALKEWAGLLRAPGWLLLSVPAHQGRYGPADELVGHFRRYDPGAMTALLASSGFTQIQLRQYGFPLGYLLEAGRNLIGRRRLATAAAMPVADRTAGSGRLLQPSGGLRGAAARWGTAPFRVVQRAFPNTGTGLVVLARSGAPRDAEAPAV
jgi:glycosyltransferase involved in cell wall biosynthesis/SAM-dependent methyltransferase